MTPMQRPVEVLLQQLHAIHVVRRSATTVGPLWDEATSFASGRGVGDMQGLSVEHELVLCLQVFASRNRVAQFCVFDVTVSLRPAIFHSCGWVRSPSRRGGGWLLTNAEIDPRPVGLQRVHERAFVEQDLGGNTAEVKSPTRDVIPTKRLLMKFGRESSDDLCATDFGTQLSGVESSFCCLRLLET